MAKKAVFIRIWPSPPIAASVERTLVESFPEYLVETIDIIRLLKQRKGLVLANILATLREYGPSSLFGRRGVELDRFKVMFFGTPYLFRAVNKLLTELLEPQYAEIAFTIQLQSLFDASQPGIPHFVYTDHTMLENLRYPDFDRRKLYSSAWLSLERTIYQNATRVFTRSSNITRSLVDQYGCPPNKVVCVYAGSNVPINESEWANGAPPTENLDRYSAKNILFVGTNWELKGGPQLVEAFLKALKTHPDARLTIVGCSPPLHHPNIEVVGRLPVQAVAPYYQRASIFCLPTLVEAFGVVFVEALSYRLPVVATAIGATADFVLEGENGSLVPPGDVESLAQALINLLDDAEKRRQFGARSFRLAKERYNWRSVGQAMRKEIMACL